MEEGKKELICYFAIFIILIILVILNNVFWRLGKNVENANNVEYLESNNVTYNVPYDEKLLD